MTIEQHHRDEDCTPAPDGTCIICGVLHGEPCPGCGAHAFHHENCPLWQITRNPSSSSWLRNALETALARDPVDAAADAAALALILDVRANRILQGQQP